MEATATIKTNSLKDIVSDIIISFSPEMTVDEALKKIKEEKYVSYTLYILDSQSHLIGSVQLSDLLTSPPDYKLKDIQNNNLPIYAYIDDDKEEVADKFRDYDLLSLPIVDENNVLVGTIEYDDAINIIREENTEDFEKMAAISVHDKPYLKTSDLSMSKSRIIWLLVLMLSSIFTGEIINHYENVFLAAPLLVAFIPMLMDTGGNCGSQSATIIIRSLATGEIKHGDFWRVMVKEFMISIIISIILIIVCGTRIILQYRNPLLALAVTCALALIVIISNLLGGTLPIIAEKIGIDPAAMASPIINTVVDTCAVLIYFKLVTLILKL